jgi:hypothetical protein
MAEMLCGIKMPDSKIAREAAELVRQHETETTIPSEFSCSAE